MKQFLYTIIFFFTFSASASAQGEPILLNGKLGKAVNVNVAQMAMSLRNTKLVQSAEDRGNIWEEGNAIELPNPEGEGMLVFRVVETPVFSPEMQKENPDIRSYTGISGNKVYTLKMSISPKGILAHIQGSSKAFVIEKLDGEYRMFSKGDLEKAYECGFDESVFEDIDLKKGGTQGRSSSGYTTGNNLRSYRMAVATTGEFYQQMGSLADVNAKINEILTLINAFYEREVALTFTLVSTNDNIAFSNPATDPFSPSGSASASASQTAFSGTTMQGLMPYTNYDIGHTFHYESPGAGFPAQAYSISGQAGPSPCQNSHKAKAWSQYTKGSSASNVPVSAIVNVIVHEMGHQFYAKHTFNGDGGRCSAISNQYQVGAAYEPGSGTTIMSYLGSCADTYNLTGNKDEYFHAISRKEIIDNFTTSASCITPTATGNSSPVANAGADYTIPVGTPFVLMGSATDANGDGLSYTWDEFDAPVSNGNDQGALGNNTTGVGGYTAVNSVTAPLFRSRQSSSGMRTFPSLDFILDKANIPGDKEGEALPLVARNMKFMLTVRDDNSGTPAVDADQMQISVVDNGGSFAVTSYNGPSLWLYDGSNTTDITWSVAGTDLTPINCSAVKISLSTDGGNTFPTVIAASTPNDGLFTYTIPNTMTSSARVKVEAVGNVFFDINNTDITITNSCNPEISNVLPSTLLTAEVGDATLNLDMQSYGSQITSISGNISGSDPVGELVLDNGSGSCQKFSNSPHYDQLAFLSLNSGTVTFDVVSTGPGLALGLNLYSQPYNVGASCSNWVASNRYYCSPSVCGSNSNLSANVAKGKNYLMVSAFNGSDTGSYSLAFTGGNIYKPVPEVGSPYAYTYLIYNVNTGLIAGFLDVPNLSSFSASNYRVYGLSYPGGYDLEPYNGTSFSTFSNSLSTGAICGKLSDNYREVQITLPCTSHYVLSSPSDDVSTGTVVLEASEYIQATNKVSGGDVRYDAGKYVEMNPGFAVDGTSGLVFKAMIDGCGGQ